MKRKVKLKEVCREITVGHVGPMADRYVESGIPFLRSQNITPFAIDKTNLKFIDGKFHEKLKKSALHPGDVVLVRTGYPGTACVIPDGMLVANCADLVILRPSEEIDGDYLACMFNSVWGKGRVAGSLVGVAQQHFNIGVAREMEVSLPPIEVQCRVSSILSTYNNLIENNDRRIQILEEMAQMIYREWFVSFRFPGHKKVKIVDSELGSIPEDWRVERLENLASITMGQSPSSEHYNEVGDGLPFHQGVTNFGFRFPVDRIFCTLQTRVAEAGDILMSVRAPVGRLNITLNKIVIGRGLCAIRSRLGLQELLFQQLKERFLDEDTMGSGTIFKAVTKEDVWGLKFVQPSKEVAGRFVELIGPMFRQLEVLTAKNFNLRNTRDLLLPKLVSGEVSVEEIEGEAAAQTV